MTANHEPQHVRTASAAPTGLDDRAPGRASHASELAAPHHPIVSGLVRRKRRAGDELTDEPAPAPVIAEPAAADRASDAWWTMTAAGGEPAMVAAAAVQILDATHAAIDDLLRYTAQPAQLTGPHPPPAAAPSGGGAEPGIHTQFAGSDDPCWRALTRGRTPEGSPSPRMPGAAAGHDDPDDGVPPGEADAKLARCYADEDVGSFPGDDVTDHR
jgi:hypothetical protein